MHYMAISRDGNGHSIDLRDFQELFGARVTVRRIA